MSEWSDRWSDCPYPSERKSEAALAAPTGSAKPRIYVFFRAEGFYPLEMKSDAEARANAESNPGTIRVENQNGESVWPNEKIRRVADNPAPQNL